MILYADTTDVAAWLGDDAAVPGNVTSLIRHASLMVAEATKTDYYTSDPVTGLPTDPVALQAFNDATCAQIALWAKNGIDPDRLGLDMVAPKRAKGIGTARVDYDTSAITGAAALAARQAATVELCDQSVSILKQAGLMMTRVWTYG